MALAVQQPQLQPAARMEAAARQVVVAADSAFSEAAGVAEVAEVAEAA